MQTLILGYYWWASQKHPWLPFNGWVTMEGIGKRWFPFFWVTALTRLSCLWQILLSLHFFLLCTKWGDILRPIPQSWVLSQAPIDNLCGFSLHLSMSCYKINIFSWQFSDPRILWTHHHPPKLFSLLEILCFYWWDHHPLGHPI